MDHTAQVIGVSRAGATRVRYAVLAFMCSLSVITYLDRVCISGSAPYIVSDLGLTPVEMGLAFTAFGIAYAAFEVPSGWLGDMIGARKVMTRIVVWWSVFTTLTGLVRNLSSLVAVRFLFGAGEAGAFPNSTKVISRWMPTGGRGFARGVVWMCARMGGALAPGLVVFMISRMGWRPSFWVFGVLGLVWAVLFWSWFRDTPGEKPGVNEMELQIIQRGQTLRPARRQVPWTRLLLSGNLWAICWMYFGMAYGWYFYITWLPTYLKARGATMLQAGVYGGMPLFLCALGCGLGGVLTGYVVKKTGNVSNRRYIGFRGSFLRSPSIAGDLVFCSPVHSDLALSLASFFGYLTLRSCWAVCLDAAHKLAGTVYRFINTSGTFRGT